MALCLDGRTWRRIFSPCQCQERRTNLHDGPSDNQCIRNITIRPNFNTHHLQQFVDLWIIVREASLNPEIVEVEVDGQRRILCSFDLSRSILWLRYYQATIVDLETVGTTKMQFFHLAYHQE